jgi:hypothetical protein
MVCAHHNLMRHWQTSEDFQRQCNHFQVDRWNRNFFADTHDLKMDRLATQTTTSCATTGAPASRRSSVSPSSSCTPPPWTSPISPSATPYGRGSPPQATAGSAPSSSLKRSLTEQAPLVIECLDDVRTRAKRQLTPQMLPFLPRCILESAARAPYLERWRLDASTAAAAAIRARCAYPTFD